MELTTWAVPGLRPCAATTCCLPAEFIGFVPTEDVRPTISFVCEEFVGVALTAETEPTNSAQAAQVQRGPESFSARGAAATRPGSSGNALNSADSAWETAPAIAPPGASVPPSPTPLAPVGLPGAGVCR